MSKIYLLKESSELNNGIYINNKYLDPEDCTDGVYHIGESENFQGSQDIVAEVRCVC